MAVSAVNTDRLDMVLVAEWHRLIDRKTDVADIVDAIDVQQNAEQQPDDSDHGNDRKAGKPIDTAMKNLRHLRTHSRMVTVVGGTPQGRGRLIKRQWSGLSFEGKSRL